MAASGECIRLYACSSLKQHASALLEPDDSRRRAVHQGQLRRPGRSQSRSWRGEDEGQPMRRGCAGAGRRNLKRRSVTRRAAVPQSTGATVSGSPDEPPAAPRSDRLAQRLLRCRQLRVIRKHGARPPLTRQGIAGTVRAAAEQTSSRDCLRRV